MANFVEKNIASKDGYALTSRLYRAQRPVPVATIVIAPAMGVVQTYYTALAAWLADQGFDVFTFDYRGIGLSRRGSLRGFKADMLDWAQLDAAALIDAAADHAPDRPLYWIGHSLGGQIFPFVPNNHRVTRMVTVAAGNGYWRENAPSLKRVVWWMWYVAVPLSLKLFGYFPGKRLRKIGDLPHGVMSQWRRWCLNPHYAVGAEGESARAAFAAVRTPLTAISFTDDEYMSARNVESLHSFYASAPQQHKRIAPQDIGVRRIGHFGFFRPAFEGPLWRGCLLPALS